MFTLLCRQTYKSGGVAYDLSPYHNDGDSTNTQFFPNGRSAGSGAVKFNGSTSRIRIPPNPSWNGLRALKVEMEVRLDKLNAPRSNLVEAHLSFAFFVNHDGSLEGTVLAPPPPAGGTPTWHGVQSAPNAVSLNTWHTLGLTHDGFRTMRVFVDGKMVAERKDLVAGLGSVGGHGVAIGNWPDANQYQLTGEVDELRVWKYDPDALSDGFISRQADPAVYRCWERLIDAMDGPNALRQLLLLKEEVEAAQTRLVGDLIGHGAAAIAKNAHYAKQYMDLWRAGKIDGPAMKKLLTEWLGWLKSIGIDLAHDPMLKNIWSNAEVGELLPHLGKFDCDPQYAEYLALLKAVLGH